MESSIEEIKIEPEEYTSPENWTDFTDEFYGEEAMDSTGTAPFAVVSVGPRHRV